MCKEVGNRSGGYRIEINESHMDFLENGYQTTEYVLKVRPLVRKDYPSNNLKLAICPFLKGSTTPNFHIKNKMTSYDGIHFTILPFEIQNSHVLITCSWPQVY